VATPPSLADIVAKSEAVPVDRGAEVAVQSKGPIDSCVDVAVKSKIPVDRGAEVAIQGKGPIDSCVDLAAESKVLVDPGASALVNGSVPSDIGHDFALASDVLIDKGPGVAVKSQTDEEKRKLQIWRRLIARENNEFQHFYANKKREEDCEMCIKDCACEGKRCLKVKELLDHKKHHKENSETNGCPNCQLVAGIWDYHKRVCPTGDCFFCRSNKENENDDPVSQNETITDVIKQISEATTLQKGERFIEGVHYKLEGMLGQGGNGMVVAVQLLEPGLATFGSKRDILLAAKRANVSKNEMIVLKQLADASNANIAPHYFLLNKHQHIPWVNRGTKKGEWKVFEHLLFMQRAEMSLKDYIKKFPDYVLPVKVASIYFRQIVNAMVNAHSLGITHNDIKAGNVLMFRGAAEDFYVAQLCDYEYARRNGHPSERHGGTEFFMPPEREDGPGRDVYALGIFFLELTITRLCRYPKDSSEWPEFK
ncbi:serine threonine kinase, partial [Paramuricea clavata]